MMRSLFSAVSGLKTHQTRMDVIGNNVANVNTVAFKSSGVTFSELMYQTISGASGASGTRGGVNAKQIGLGVSTGSTKVRITSSGAAETTGDPFDVRLTDANSTNFFIVNNGSKNLFTRAGSFYIDGAGNLCMTSTGYTVMGWQVDPTTGGIRKDQVSALKVMEEKNLTSAPEATTNARAAGVVDKTESNVNSDDGYVMILNFFDALGYNYVAKFSVKVTDPKQQQYSVELTDILDSKNHSVLNDYIATQPDRNTALSNLFGQNAQLNKSYTCSDPNLIYDGGNWRYRYTSYSNSGTGPVQNTQLSNNMVQDPNNPMVYTVTYTVYSEQDIKNQNDPTYTGPPVTGTNVTKTIDLTEVFGVSADRINGTAQGSTGNFTMTPTWNANQADANYVVQFNYSEPTVNYPLKYSPDDGTFTYVGAQGSNSVSLNLADALGGNFSNISIDFSQSRAAAQGEKTTLGLDAGAIDKETGIGRKLGAMIGISINGDGRIFGSYDNGNTELLGQIAVAQFANASGLEKIGENCYDTTLNSGDFDGIGVDISADGSKMTSGELEMSNVDLSTEFTSMIITQRGFQSNSRVITTSDTLLEELINLKR